MRCGAVFEELAVEVVTELPGGARREVLDLIERVLLTPRAWPDVRDAGAIEEIREAFGARCWIQYMPHDGAIAVREIGWAG
ncbi:hypothetical protein [Streptomyces flavofungini]|uniref:hypothetical protein n=1 Tax=Streptomyces flavofungini TaxID=68200 RepID=UPI0025B13DD0|nr:hypothetical protein [Streptomyces flavofungini]WJV44529.1 hypothetical protein QUY26_02675 [Streptomyces flavofungini]